MKQLSADQIRNALQVGFAGFVATAVFQALGPNPNQVDGFYILYGVARSLLPTAEASLAAARARVVGTVFGGVVVALLTLVLSNWLAVGIGYVLIQLGGRRLGLNQATLMNACITAILLLAVPEFSALDGWYVFDRAGWHLVGLLIGMAIERLFWFRPALQRLQDSEKRLCTLMLTATSGKESIGAESLIGLYAQHCKIRSTVLQSHQAGTLQLPGFVERDELLEQALQHAVAMQRAPKDLRHIDQEACEEALSNLREPLRSP